MKRSRRGGQKPALNLFLIGGAAETCLAEFARLAGGSDANIVVVPHASEDAQESADSISAALRAAGVTQITICMPGSPLVLSKSTTAVYMGGGDQKRLTRTLTAADLATLLAFALKGGLVGGSSAGAMCVSNIMIGGGLTEEEPDLMLRVGLRLLWWLFVDTHFANRDRFVRPAAALALHPEFAGAIGLDEDTALHIRGNNATVFGKGRAWIYRVLERGARFSISRRSYANGKKLRLPCREA